MRSPRAIGCRFTRSFRASCRACCSPRSPSQCTAMCCSAKRRPAIRSIRSARVTCGRLCHSGQDLVVAAQHCPELHAGRAGGYRRRGSAAGFVELALFITILIVTVRRVILFPAIAVDAPGATWSNARRDTKGSSWRVAFILFCVAVPGTILGGLLYWALLSGGLGGANQLFLSLLGAIVEIPMLCAFAAAASHIFRSRADTLAQPV